MGTTHIGRGTPKGRTTIRKGGSLTGIHGPTSRPIKLWTFDPEPNTIFAQLEQAYFSALDAVDRVEQRTRTSASTGKFTAAGVKDDVLKFALNELVPALHKARLTIKKAKAEIAERKSKLKVGGPDKTDIAGAFRRMEIRTFLREMNPEAQAKYFASLGGNIPREVAMAISELPPEFSGVPKSRHDLLMENALQAQHGPEITEIAQLEEAIAIAENAVEAGRTELRFETGMQDEAKFNELAAPIESKYPAPWLRKHIENGEEVVRVVDLERGVEKVATPDEIERGVFYKDYAQYKAGRAA
ncbi:MAG TPA: hypothetical protein VH678_32930 [Xanthobacteraceae bacterium]